MKYDMLITVLALMLVIPGQAYALTNFYFALPAPIDENTLRGANFTVEYPWQDFKVFSMIHEEICST
jgi:hypothetical protein